MGSFSAYERLEDIVYSKKPTSIRRVSDLLKIANPEVFDSSPLVVDINYLFSLDSSGYNFTTGDREEDLRLLEYFSENRDCLDSVLKDVYCSDEKRELITLRRISEIVIENIHQELEQRTGDEIRRIDGLNGRLNSSELLDMDLSDVFHWWQNFPPEYSPMLKRRVR